MKALSEKSPRIVVEDFGSAPLIAEYDAEQRTIRVNARMLEWMRERHGDAAAEKLFACAAAHERFHMLYPQGTEEGAHAYARRQTEEDPHYLERMLEDFTNAPKPSSRE